MASRRLLRFARLARIQPYLWFAGMTLFSTSYHIAGLRGLPRRVYSAALTGEYGAPYVLTEVAAAGGVILFISALAFVAVVLATWIGGKRITPPAFEFAVPLQRPTTVSVWDRFGLWTVVAILLIVGAYAYPLIQLLAHPRFGSPAFKAF